MRLTKTLREAFVRAAIADVPQIDYQTRICDEAMKFAVSLLPKEAQVVYAKYPNLIKTDSVYLGGQYIHLPGDAEFNTEQKAQLEALTEQRKEQSEAIDELRIKLGGVANSVHTVKALKELLPEFVKYLPDETKVSTNLPAIANIISDFVKAGWPDKQKAVTA